MILVPLDKLSRSYAFEGEIYVPAADGKGKVPPDLAKIDKARVAEAAAADQEAAREAAE